MLMVKHYLSNKHKIHKRKGLLTFSLFFLILVNLNHKLNAQEQFQYGFIGGLNMSTITAKNHDSGFKMGFNIGGVAQYLINNNSCIAANLNLSSKGQQFSKIEENSLNYLKIYHSTTLYYIDIPLLYQYYVKAVSDRRRAMFSTVRRIFCAVRSSSRQVLAGMTCPSLLW